MDIEIKRIIEIAILFVFAFACHAGVAPEPNEPNVVKAELSTENTKVDSAATLVPEKQKPIDQIEAELAKEYYKDCVQNLKWALGIIIGLVAGIVGYAVFKSRREYRETLADVKQALGDTREACKEARAASDKAREYEEKAQERLSSLDEVVGNKLKEIEEKGKTLIKSLIQEAEKQRESSREEAEKQRKISELWNEGLRAMKAEEFDLAAKRFSQIVKDFNSEDGFAWNNWALALSDLAKRKEGARSEALFHAAFEKFEKAVQIKPDDHEAYSNWGAALGELAKRKEGTESEALSRAALEKFEKAVQIKPDFHEAYSNWGTALTELAKRKEETESESLLRAALEKFEKAVQIKPDYHAAYKNCGAALIELAKWKDEENRGRVLEEAERKCLKAESLMEGSGAYNLACVCALLGKEAECRKWLETGSRCGTLPTRSKAMADPDLESVRNEEWFKQIRWP
jgi:tetratricopeptide (TPR) repeat protein